MKVTRGVLNLRPKTEGDLPDTMERLIAVSKGELKTCRFYAGDFEKDIAGSRKTAPQYNHLLSSIYKLANQLAREGTITIGTQDVSKSAEQGRAGYTVYTAVHVPT